MEKGYSKGNEKMSLKKQVREQLDAALAGGAEPFPLRGSVGLYVRVPGRQRAIALFRDGQLNAAGRYYYREREAPDRGFSPAPPLIVGRQEFGTLGDGHRVLLRTYRNGVWQPTRLGLQYYRDKKNSWVVYFPCTDEYEHPGGRKSYGHGEFVASTATDLGTLQVPASLSEAEQEAEVRRRAVEFVAGLEPDHDGKLVIRRDYYLRTYLEEDWKEHLTFEREEVSTTAQGALAVEATRRRGLRFGRPWMTLEVEARRAKPEAYDETDGKCVLHQLGLLATRDGRPIWGSEAEVEAALDGAGWDGGDWREEGVCPDLAALVCEREGVAVQVWWKDRLVISRPGGGGGDGVAFVVWGDHAYFCEPQPKATEGAPPASVPATQVATCEHAPGRSDDFEDWRELQEDLQPGATYRAPEREIQAVRAALHARRVVPEVRLANATEYGLAAGLWTSDLATAHRVSRALKAGTVWVNCYEEGDMTFPFGGVKMSGFGRDKSLHAFDKYTELKTTWIRVDPA